MSNHRAGPPANVRHKAPLTTGRLALWLGFWLMIAIMILGFVTTLAGRGSV